MIRWLGHWNGGEAVFGLDQSQSELTTLCIITVIKANVPSIPTFRPFNLIINPALLTVTDPNTCNKLEDLAMIWPVPKNTFLKLFQVSCQV